MEQASDQSRQYLERSIDEVLRFVQLVWTWSSDQIIKVTQAPWDHWPLWKQVLLLIVAAAVVYFLFIAAMQLWTAAINVLAAFATFIGTVIVTLPTILIAGLIALAGLWVVNNVHDLSSLSSLITFPKSPSGSSSESGNTPSGSNDKVTPSKMAPLD
jgi:uncharacterized membrane protein YgcG